jgi:hypothetical protein
MQESPPPGRTGGQQIQEVESGQHQKRLHHLYVEAKPYHSRTQEQPAQASPLRSEDEGPGRQEKGQDQEGVHHVVALDGDAYRGDG